MKQLLVLFTVLLLSSCEEMLDKKVDINNWQADIQEMKAKHEIDTLGILSVETAVELINNPELNTTHLDITNESYRNIIVKMRSLMQTDQMEDSLKNLQSNFAAKRIDSTITIKLINKEYVEEKMDNSLVFKFQVKNKTKKVIDTLVEDLLISSLYNQLIFRVRINLDHFIIPADSSIDLIKKIHYIINNDGYTAVKELAFNKIKIALIPVKVVFGDGTSIYTREPAIMLQP